jgi:hypothetical protein
MTGLTFNPERIEWLGRIEFFVEPGSNSSGIATPARAPVLSSGQPYDGRIVTAPMIVGPQRPPAYPAFDPLTDEGKALRIVGGVPRGAVPVINKRHLRA